MSLPVEIQKDLLRLEDLNKEEIRELIARLENELKNWPQIEIPVTHFFSKGVYGREITIPNGSIIIGKIHKYPAMNVLSKGDVSVFSVDGVMRLKAPHTFVSSPGAKRVFFAHEESVWSTFHGTDETDPKKIEKEFIAESYEDVPAIALKDREQLCPS